MRYFCFGLDVNVISITEFFGPIGELKCIFLYAGMSGLFLLLLLVSNLLSLFSKYAVIVIINTSVFVISFVNGNFILIDPILQDRHIAKLALFCMSSLGRWPHAVAATQLLPGVIPIAAIPGDAF